MPTLQELTDRVRDMASRHPELSRPVTFDLGEAGVIHADAGAVGNTDGPADCRISLSADDLEALIESRLDPTMAYMTGQLRIDGDMTLALQLAQALRGA
jgi:putative sterol carrier protein